MVRTRFALVVAVAVLASPAAAQEKGRKVAFLVGVGTFKHDLPELNGAPQRDVTELGKVLKAGGFEVVTLIDKEATKDAIEKRFLATLDGNGKASEALGKGDVLLVALCTHGFTIDVADAGGAKKQVPFVAGYDARPGDPKAMVPLNGLIDAARPFGPTALFLVDACREVPVDPNRGATRGIEGTQMTLPKRTAVLFSCGQGQLAHQSDKLGGGHGLFTYAVLKTLRGETGLKGEVSWTELVAGVEKAFKTAEFTVHIPPDRVQTPVLATGELASLDLLKVVPGGEFAADLRDYSAAYMKGWFVLEQHMKRAAVVRVDEWRRGAEANMPAAQFLYGLCLEKGYGLKEDKAAAVALYRKAADAGEPKAMCKLAYELKHSGGPNWEKDRLSAAPPYRRAANMGETAGMVGLADAYWHGEGGVANDRKQALGLYEKAAGLGDTNASHEMAFRHQLDRNYKEAIRWYEKAGAAGNHGAMYMAGRVYTVSSGDTVHDYQKAFEWFRKAGELGFPAAMYQLGTVYSQGNGVPKNEKLADEWHRKGAAAGNTDAMYQLGERSEEGTVAAKDEKAAAVWYRLAADGGHGWAAYRLGKMYADGRGVDKDGKEAVRLLERACVLGYSMDVGFAKSSALFELGKMYEEGWGVEKNLEKAVEYYKSEDADFRARLALGKMYEEGRGVPKDEKAAAAIYQKFAGFDEVAMYRLGRLHEEGRGVVKDLDKAVELYRKAAMFDNSDAKAALNAPRQRVRR